jgi:hypothetical protein
MPAAARSQSCALASNAVLASGIGFAAQDNNWSMTFVRDQQRRAKHAGARKYVDRWAGGETQG